MSRRATRNAAVAWAVLLAAAGAPSAQTSGPDVRFLTVTDVTPRSFQVAWISSDPSAATLRLFEAPDCLDEIFTAEITPFPTLSGDLRIVTAAQDKGVMLVRAARLQPDTEYCVQTVTTSLFSGQQTIAPATPLKTRTQKRTTRSRPVSPGDPNEIAFSNDLAQFAITHTDPFASTRGTLVLLTVKGAASPLASFVGDAVDDDDDPNTYTALAIVDLNNLYGAATGESLDMTGDGTEPVSARAIGSPEGFVTVHARRVPTDAGLAEAKDLAPCPSVTGCDGRLGDSDGDGSVTATDADAITDYVVGLLATLPCEACADATYDLDLDMKDALAIAQVVAGLRLLPW